MHSCKWLRQNLICADRKMRNKEQKLLKKTKKKTFFLIASLLHDVSKNSSSFFPLQCFMTQPANETKESFCPDWAGEVEALQILPNCACKPQTSSTLGGRSKRKKGSSQESSIVLRRLLRIRLGQHVALHNASWNDKLLEHSVTFKENVKKCISFLFALDIDCPWLESSECMNKGV